jgi:hypothetical protein
LKARDLFTSVALALSLLPVRQAHGAGRVSLSMAAPSDDELRRFETQLRAELLAMGFDVLTHAGSSGERDPSELRTGSTAVITIGRAEGAVVAQVWVRDRKTSKPVLKTIRPEPSALADPSILAVRTAELLRAILLESGPVRPEEPVAAPWRPSAPRATQTPGAPRGPEAPLRWGVLAGVSFVGAPGGIPMSVAPTLAVAWYPTGRAAVEISGTGPILSVIDGPQGSAGIEQEMASARFRFAFLGIDHIAVPYGVAGFGAHHLRAKGNTAGAYVGMSDDAWTWLGLGGAGLRLRMQRNVAVDLEIDCIFTGAKQSVVFDRSTAASTGRPIVSGTAGVGLQW